MMLKFAERGFCVAHHLSNRLTCLSHGRTPSRLGSDEATATRQDTTAPSFPLCPRGQPPSFHTPVWTGGRPAHSNFPRASRARPGREPLREPRRFHPLRSSVRPLLYFSANWKSVDWLRPAARLGVPANPGAGAPAGVRPCRARQVSIGPAASTPAERAGAWISPWLLKGIRTEPSLEGCCARTSISGLGAEEVPWNLACARWVLGPRSAP